MGVTYLFAFTADEIDNVDPNGEHWGTIGEQVGEGVLRLTRDPGYYFRTDSGSRRTAHRLGHTDNGTIYLGEVHTSEEKVFFWIGNRLAPLDRLKPDEIAAARQLLSEAHARLTAAPAP